MYLYKPVLKSLSVHFLLNREQGYNKQIIYIYICYVGIFMHSRVCQNGFLKVKGMRITACLWQPAYDRSVFVCTEPTLVCVHAVRKPVLLQCYKSMYVNTNTASVLIRAVGQAPLSAHHTLLEETLTTC